MVMTEVFDKLKNLQSILVKKYDLEKKIDEAPKQLGSQDELLDRMKKEFISKNTEYEVVKAKVMQLRGDLDEVVKSREDGEKSMDNITTHREYEALDKQITEASSKEQDIRKELQKEEKILADLNDNLKSYEAMIKSQETDLNVSKSSLDKELTSYKNELEDLNKKENKIAPDLDQEILFKFQRIIQRNTEGIVAVKNGVCTGCHMILPAQFANEVRKGENILFCPYCSRILFYEETTENEQESYFKLDDAGSLADIDDDEDFDTEDEYEKDEDELSEDEDTEETEESTDEEDEEGDDSEDSESEEDSES
ncbi:MAG: C4-type zinc ribbon domain-containing protein [Treponema sp.]|nr:C4-type zinc ribbon domain-containing protein [Treponema sp.]